MRFTTIGTLVATIALAAAVLLPAERAAADCDDSFLRCDYWQEYYPFPLENRMLATELQLKQKGGRTDPKALALYRRIVDQVGYRMPRGKPRFAIYMTSVTVGNEAMRPFVVSDYLEGNLSMLVSHDGEDGWYSLGMPMNDLGAQSAGARFGYPKYVATMKLDDTSPLGGPVPDRVTHTATVKGLGTTLQLAWRHDEKAPLRTGLKDIALFRDPFFMDNKPNVGPDQWRTKLTPLPLLPTRQLSDGNLGDETTVDGVNGFVPKRGYAAVTLHPDVNRYDAQNAAAYKIAPVLRPGESLADLLQTRQTAPATYLHIQENLFYQNKKLTRGESCITPPQADPLYGYLFEPLQTQVRATTGCQAP